jgi:hypothetical protein
MMSWRLAVDWCRLANTAMTSLPASTRVRSADEMHEPLRFTDDAIAVRVVKRWGIEEVLRR